MANNLDEVVPGSRWKVLDGENKGKIWKIASRTKANNTPRVALWDEEKNCFGNQGYLLKWFESEAKWEKVSSGKECSRCGSLVNPIDEDDFICKVCREREPIMSKFVASVNDQSIIMTVEASPTEVSLVWDDNEIKIDKENLTIGAIAALKRLLDNTA